MTDIEKQDGHQITLDSLEKAIKNYIKSNSVKVRSFETSAGSKQGEGYTCVIFAVKVKAIVDGKEQLFHFIAKCLPANNFRAKFIVDVSKLV